jgi:hypothetical protein
MSLYSEAPRQTLSGGVRKSWPYINAKAVVDRQDSKAQACEILVFGISIMVIVQIIEAQKHLSIWAAVHIDQARSGLRLSLWDKKLTVNGISIFAFEDDLPWNN